MRPSHAAVMGNGRNCKYATGVACPRCEVCDSLAQPDCALMCWCHLACKASVKGKEDAMHALERRQSPMEEAAKFRQRLNERSQREGIVVGAVGTSVQPRAREFGAGVAKRVTSVEMPNESGARATDIARKEIPQRMHPLKEQLQALEPQRDERPGRDVYADAMGGKEEVGHPVHHSVPQKTQHIGMASHVGSVTRKGLDKWCDEEPDNLISHNFHIRTDCCFTVKSMMSSNTFMSKAFPR